MNRPLAPITLLSADHVPAYRALMLQAYEEAADAFTSTPEERAREPLDWWQRRIADPDGLTLSLGAFDGEAMVGTVALEFSAKPKTRHKALLVGMYVAPQARRQGLALALMQAALAQCRARDGLLLVQLEVTDGNDAALALYQALGFQTFGLEPMALLTPGGFRAKRHLWRLLSDAGTPAGAASGSEA